MGMAPLDIALIVLAVAGVWAVVEIALTARKARKAVNQTCESVNNTIDEITPIITKVDGIVDEIQPASKQVEPLLEKANVAVDALTVDLASVDNILADVSCVTGTASGVTNSVTKATNAAANAAVGFLDKVSHKKPEAQGCLEAPQTCDASSEDKDDPAEEQTAQQVGQKARKADYFTYPARKEDE